MKDEKATIEEIKQAAEQGHAATQFFLGRMYSKGDGVPKNDKEAVRWYRLAAGQGDAGAQAFLGAMHYAGQGTPQNYREAYIWFSLAAANGFEKAFEGRKKAAKELTTADLGRAQDEASRRMEKIDSNQAEQAQ